MHIRRAVEADVSTCVGLLREPVLELPAGGYGDETFFAGYLSDVFFVACEDEAPVGCVVGERVRGGAIVWFLVIAQEHRGQGIGSRLLEAFEQDVRSSGAQWIILYAPSDAEGVQRFYDRNGYVRGELFRERKKDL